MIRRPPRSTLDRSSAASDVYKRQLLNDILAAHFLDADTQHIANAVKMFIAIRAYIATVSYTHLRAHETVLDLVCRLLLEKKKNTKNNHHLSTNKNNP